MSNSNKLKNKDKNFVWHPFTQMKDYIKEAPLIIKEGKGCYLKDINGRSYIDGISSLWVNLHGHRKKEIDAAIKKQLSKISHSTLLGFSNVPAVELAEELVKISPKGLDKVFFSDDGSTAVEIAIKMACQYWQQQPKEEYRNKTKFISFTGAYHGDTLGSVSIGGIELFHKIYNPLLFDVIRAKYPYCYRCPWGKEKQSCVKICLFHLEKLIIKNHFQTAALIIEPLVQGAAGMVTALEGFLKHVWQLCKKYNILLIADEVAVGFGRTGKMFACEHEGVSPDIMALAKGITGGYLPLAATLVTKKIYDGFLGEYKDKKTFFHGHSYTGNQLACAAALANLNLFKKEKVLEKVQKKSIQLKNMLEKFYEIPIVGDIRQKGLMVGIELVKDKESKKGFNYEDKIGIKVCQEAIKRGVIIRPLGDVIVLMPPLSISLKDLKKLVDVVEEAIRKIAGFRGQGTGDREKT
jgi:adenosylmethionine-8-amino-7-oxononanoate transaminase